MPNQVSDRHNTPTAATNIDGIIERLAQHAAKLAYSERDLDALGLLSRKSRWRLRRENRFPEPVAAGGRKLYKATEILAWLDDPKAWAERQRAETGDGDARPAA